MITLTLVLSGLLALGLVALGTWTTERERQRRHDFEMQQRHFDHEERMHREFHSRD